VFVPIVFFPHYRARLTTHLLTILGSFDIALIEAL